MERAFGCSLCKNSFYFVRNIHFFLLRFFHRSTIVIILCDYDIRFDDDFVSSLFLAPE